MKLTEVHQQQFLSRNLHNYEGLGAGSLAWRKPSAAAPAQALQGQRRQPRGSANGFGAAVTAPGQLAGPLQPAPQERMQARGLAVAWLGPLQGRREGYRNGARFLS